MTLRRIAPFVLGLALLAGCNQPSGNTAQEDSGEIIADVGLQLVEQGFEPIQVGPQYKNSAYYLMPFGKPLGVEYDPNSEATCYFFLVGEGYPDQGIGLADYPINYLNSEVDIWMIPVDSEGAMADLDYSEEPATAAISEVTPQFLVDNFDVTGCGNTTLE